MKRAHGMAVAAIGMPGLIAGTASGAQAADKTSCIPPSTKVNIAEFLDLSRIVDGLEVGEYTVESLEEQIDTLIDVNDDGFFSYMAPNNLRAQSVKACGYYYLAGDNNHPL